VSKGIDAVVGSQMSILSGLEVIVVHWVGARLRESTIAIGMTLSWGGIRMRVERIATTIAIASRV
jgi:hypothetical protein